MNPGDQTATVANAHIFTSGQEATLTPTGSTEESLTIQSIDYGTGKITFTTAAKKLHDVDNIVLLANNGGGSGPRILVEQKDSIYGFTKNGVHYPGFGFFEGTLNSEDIYDEEALKEWAARQLSVLAWPQIKSQVQLSTTSARISGRDLVQIGPFDDGGTLIQNVQSVQYNATAADKNI